MIRRTILPAVLTAAILSALAGCGEEMPAKPVVGVITEKDHSPDVWQDRVQQLYTTKKSCTTKKTTSCTTTRQKAGTRTVRVLIKHECWELELDTGWEGCVNKAVWESLDEQDTYDSSQY